MRRIYTERNTAKVVQAFTVRNRPYMKLVTDSMGELKAAVKPDLSVTLTISRANPKPASAIRFWGYLLKQAS